MASYSAVPPFAVTRLTARLIARRSVVQSWTSAGLVGELQEEQLVVGTEQVVDEAVDRRPRGRHLVGGHAAARVEGDAEAHRHPFVAEVGDLLALPVFVDR